ncbi:MAG: lysophospholipid acyltransferase family protein [Pseudomonadota bacterium]
MTTKDTLRRWIPRDILELGDRLHFNTGPSGYDAWGLHRDDALMALTVSRWLYRHYFRVQCHGIDQIPDSGRCLIIANHSGQVFPIDAMMICTAIALRERAPRAVRAMAERFFPTTPFLGDFVFRTGMTLGDPLNCRRLLEHEEAILVFPEGERGFIKDPEQKYQLQRMGNGFVRLAVETGAPIIPVGVIGCEELTPNFGRNTWLAHKLGLPALPLSLPIALPAQVHLHFGEPIHFHHGDFLDSDYDDMVDTVRSRLDELIQTGLAGRDSVF